MRIAIIGAGAIASFVQRGLQDRGHTHVATLIRGSKVPEDGSQITSAADLPPGTELVIDCAGHPGLLEHGADLLAGGTDVLTLSLGALADPQTETALTQAAKRGGARLHLASGAIGALDALRAACIGPMDRVTYTGRKPPAGWRGSPAEDTLDLDTLTEAAAHFEGTAREAALAYPKNANVAAAVALAGPGFDATEVRLIADPQATANIHEITAQGAFGNLSFTIAGNALPDNPRSSLLAAQSALAGVDRLSASVGF